MKITFFGICTALLTAVSSGALAVTFFDNGTSSVISTDIQDSIYLWSGASVEVTTGGKVTVPNQGFAPITMGAVVDEGSMLSVSGGTIVGGGPQGPDEGTGDGVIVGDSSFTMTDGEVRAGSGAFTQGPVGRGIHAVRSQVTIAGGSVQSRDPATFGRSSPALDFLDTMFDISGGTFTTGGGSFGEAVATFAGRSGGRISGGTFTHHAGILPVVTPAIFLRDKTQLSISGGVFTSGFSLFDNSLLNIAGMGLTQNADGLVTGTLSDGTAFSQVILLSDSAVLLLQNSVSPIPLPASLPLLLAGLVGLAGLRRKIS